MLPSAFLLLHLFMVTLTSGGEVKKLYEWFTHFDSTLPTSWGAAVLCLSLMLFGEYENKGFKIEVNLKIWIKTKILLIMFFLNPRLQKSDTNFITALFNLRLHFMIKHLDFV